MFDDYLAKLVRGIKNKAGNEKLLDLNSLLSFDHHAQKLILSRNIYGIYVNCNVVKLIIGYFLFIKIRHTWNKATLDKVKLLIPDT